MCNFLILFLFPELHSAVLQSAGCHRMMMGAPTSPIETPRAPETAKTPSACPVQLAGWGTKGAASRLSGLNSPSFGTEVGVHKKELTVPAVSWT